MSDFLDKKKTPALSPIERLIAVKIEEMFEERMAPDFYALVYVLGLKPSQATKGIINLFDSGYLWLNSNGRRIMNRDLIGEEKK